MQQTIFPKGRLKHFSNLKTESKAFSPSPPPCNVVPLYELPLAENEKHPNFEWRGEGRDIGFFSEVTPILLPIVVAQAFALFC